MSLASRLTAPSAVAALVLALTLPGAAAADVVAENPSPGKPGFGDPYFPLDGNRGYDVRRYKLEVTYEPDTDVLTGVATIRAVAHKDLSAFNLDLDGLTVRSVDIGGKAATWTRDAAELTIDPTQTLRDGKKFTAVIAYDGVPKIIDSPDLGLGGVIPTDDGAVIIGQPHVASAWFPVNDHPIDKAKYVVRVTVPTGLEAVSNGLLTSEVTDGDLTTWSWREKDPMASYLATATIGDFDIDTHRGAGTQFLDALDPDLFDVAQPHTGEQYALSQKADGAESYKRLMRTISVPAEAADASMSFWVTRDTEATWDFAFVEAHTVGGDDWTTLPDVNEHNSNDVGNSCPYWLELHPFLDHYQTAVGDTCSPTGTTGEWWAATGASGGEEQWSVDLAAYAGSDVEVSISYASDDIFQGSGVFVDDIEVSTGEGSTSFEDDGDTFDGWTVPGAPEGSASNPNDWIVGTPADAPATTGDIAAESFARGEEILDFLQGFAGPYPFNAAGGIVDDTDEFSFALENQTRPIYAKGFFSSPAAGANVMVHELAHQWYGDSVAVRKWRHIWMNEGFASYAEWLWSEEEGDETPQEIFDFYYDAIPADDPFWELTIGDPGPTDLFAGPVYTRGAMTLQALRVEIGDDDFFHILKSWPQRREGSHSTTQAFLRFAERLSGNQLDDLFNMWLFTPTKPDLGARTGVVPDLTHPPAAVEAQLTRLRLQGESLFGR